MSPLQVFNSMALPGGCHATIRHGEGVEWAIRPDDDRPSLLRQVGDASRRISKKHPVLVEFVDPEKRSPVIVVAALRRLRRFLEKNGFAEESLEQAEFGASVTFVSASQARARSRKADIAEPTTLPDIPIHSTAPAANEEQLRQVEDTFEIQLPPQYRDFLLRWNGGVPETPWLDFGDDDHGPLQITRFLSVTPSDGPDEEYRLQSIIEFQWGSLDLPEDFIPIAMANEDIVILQVKGGQVEGGQDTPIGSVRLWYGISSGYETENTVLLADSFTEFLRKLRGPAS